MSIDVEELKRHAPIIDYVKSFYPKIPISDTKGTVYIKCLWHDENTPSLALFKDGKCKCFGCGYHGDIIDIVQKLENTTWKDACEIIANNVGYEIDTTPPNPAHKAYKDAMDSHNRRYWVNLQNSNEAMDYLLDKRQVSPDMINLFRLGLTDMDEFKYRSDIGNISNRIVFPLLEHKAARPQCVGMAYRSLLDVKPKYINDHNQDGREGQNTALQGVFIKGNFLYGFPQALQGIRRLNHAVLVEGYFDVISMHQSGFVNTVGLMGTNVTAVQAEEIRKRTGNVILMLDNDTAGRKAILRNLPVLYSAGLNVAICIIDDHDPDEMCKRNHFNYHVLHTIIESRTKQAIDYVSNAVTEKYQTVATAERYKAMANAERILNSIVDENTRALMRSMILKRLDL